MQKFLCKKIDVTNTCTKYMYQNFVVKNATKIRVKNAKILV